MQRADGGVASALLFLPSTPQSIRLAAYCQLPVRGAFWITTNQKLSPRAGKVSRRSRDERGKARRCQVLRGVPPSVGLRRASSPSGEPFWCVLQTPAQLRRAANDGPYSAHYKPLAKTRGRTASLSSSQSLTLTRRKADFTWRSHISHCAGSHHMSNRGYTANAKCELISALLTRHIAVNYA